MKIDELVPFKNTDMYKTAKDQLDYDHKLNRPTRVGIITSKLKNMGYVLHSIGTGAYAEVFKRPQDNYVIKIFGEDKGYLTYLKYMMQHQNNPHVPKMHGSLVKPFKDRPLYIVRMEILKPKEWDEEAHRDLVFAIDYALSGSPTDSARYKRLIKKQYPQLLPVIEDIQKILGDNTNFRNDIHTGNIMYREDGTPVITDPLY